MKCSIVKDLLSNYIDGLCSGETNAEIEGHLEGCPDCRSVYEKMKAPIPGEIPPEDKDIDFLKGLKARILRKNVMIAMFTCALILAGLFIFAKNYELPLPFDANRMSVELFKAAVVANEDGGISLESIDPALYGGVIPEDSPGIIDAVRLSYRGINRISENSRGRTVNRNGEEVRVVYYCYTKSLWDSLFFDGDLAGYSESGHGYGSDIYGDTYESTVYKPQRREIYYLPMRNIHKIDELSDQEFDSLREKCDLIWSGVI